MIQNKRVYTSLIVAASEVDILIDYKANKNPLSQLKRQQGVIQ